MEIKEINEKETWESFLSKCKEKTFLQSWGWGEFQIRRGNKIWRLGFFKEEVLIAVALVSKVKAKRGTFFLIQHGPVLVELALKKEVLAALLPWLKKTGKTEGVSFARFNPLWERDKVGQKLFGSLGVIESPMHASAYEATWKLDISMGEEELLTNMRKTTRYLVRQALRNPELEVYLSQDSSDIEAFDKLNQVVAKHQKFVPFSYGFLKNEFEVFSKDGQALLFFGKYQGKIAAACFVIFWSGIGFYHYAASLPGYAKFSIPYLLQWEAIKEAKKRGCLLYDFWGYIDLKDNPKHPWAGPTLFKMGFGGKAFEYVKTQDYPLSWKYWLTYVFERLRRVKRGL